MNRFDYLDIAKGIGIILVVWAHIMLVGVSHRIIYAFHMPLFFFISGMLFNKDKFTSLGQFLKQRAKRLLVPYFFYSVATWCMWAAFRFFRHDEVNSYFMPLLQTLIAQGSGEFIVHNSALWFIPCLFAVEIMYFLFCKANEWVTLALCFVTAGIGALLVYLYGSDYLFLLPWNLDAAFFALPFYGVANAMRRHLSHEKLMNIVKDNRFIVSTIVAAFYIFMSHLAMQYGECSMGSSSYNCPILVFFIRAFAGCFSIIGLSALICSHIKPHEETNQLNTFNHIRHLSDSIYRATIWCGKNSLDIMCLHIPIKGVAVIAITKFLHLTFDLQENLLYSSIAFAITMIVMIPIILGINKLCVVKKH